MKKNELKAARIRQDKDSAYMAALIGKSDRTYRKKESGEIKFTPDEIATVAKALNLSLDEVNTIFFDSKITVQ